MIKDTVSIIGKLVDAGRMDSDVRALAVHERYHSTAGFRRAATLCLERLRGAGLNAELLSYPADDDILYESQFTLRDWVCPEGWLALEDEPFRLIADRVAMPCSVIQRSGAQPDREKRFELVRADAPDVSGKVILLRDKLPDEMKDVFLSRGAVGVVYSEMSAPRREDIIKWISFTDPDLSHIFGFAVTPREGDRIERRIGEGETSGTPVRARCFVEASRHPSTIENVTARIEGETNEEVLLVAHLCHLRGSANDNLSGVAAVMEAARALSRATESGLLAKPRRSVRILLVPEYLGSYAYVSKLTPAQRANLVAGLNLDMVGASQSGHNGPLSICDTPAATPSFVADLAWAVNEELGKDDCITSKYGYVPLYISCATGFRGGSDHAVFSDPLLWTPMPMLGQEPDFFYHTSGDLPEILDPFILKKSATLAAVFAYTLATLSEDDVKIILGVRAETLLQHLTGLIELWRDGKLSEEERLIYTGSAIDRGCAAAADFLRFFPDGPQAVRDFIHGEIASLRETAELFLAPFSGAGKAGVHPKAKPYANEERYAWVPLRTFAGPVHDLKKILRARGKSEASYDAYTKDVPAYDIAAIEHQMEYFIDGRRTCAEIINEALLEGRGDRDFETLYRYMLILEEAELIQRKKY
ncbi:MAG: DUF4910 domain-containing protein [Clostridiales Family XIII bacterium]|jgi:hypothetical protein|nr:DUF4910 domain-containing protein [Clostridiales Family XIII bacterium]